MKDDIKTVLQNTSPVDFKGKTALVTGDLYCMVSLQAKNPCFCHEGANLMLGETA
jgi:hypothetical protein